MDKSQEINAKLQCIHCKKFYSKSQTLETHIRNYHSGAKAIQCILCMMEFRNERLLNGHLNRVHASFPCTQCDKKYRSRESLRLHEFNHAGEAKFICGINDCTKAFINPRRLRDHRRTHDAKLDYFCEYCGYRTRIRVNFMVHKRRHTGEQPYCCEKCGKCFPSKQQLTDHMVVHAQKRTHKCTYCGVSFVQAKSLYHHMHLHLDAKKFVCKLCGKSFAQSAGLSAHLRLHRKNDKCCMAAKICVAEEQF